MVEWVTSSVNGEAVTDNSPNCCVAGVYPGVREVSSAVAGNFRQRTGDRWRGDVGKPVCSLTLRRPLGFGSIRGRSYSPHPA
jgi:hypothetical protein